MSSEPPVEFSDVKADMIGPPDSISNIAPIKCYIPPNETLTEENYRLKRMEVLKWNQEFWAKHNEGFFKVSEQNTSFLRHDSQ